MASGDASKLARVVTQSIPRPGGKSRPTSHNQPLRLRPRVRGFRASRPGSRFGRSGGQRPGSLRLAPRDRGPLNRAVARRMAPAINAGVGWPLVRSGGPRDATAHQQQPLNRPFSTA